MTKTHPVYPATVTDLQHAPSAEPRPSQTACANIYKAYLGHSVSRLAMIVSERAYQFSLMGKPQEALQAQSYDESLEALAPKRTALAMLLWVMQWVARFTAFGTVSRAEDAPYFTGDETPLNRKHQRAVERLSGRAGFAVRIRPPYLLGLLCKGLSYTRRLKVLAQFTLSGWVRVFELVSVGSVLQRLSMITSFDQQDWHAPMGTAVADGLWEVQLPPS